MKVKPYIILLLSTSRKHVNYVEDINYNLYIWTTKMQIIVSPVRSTGHNF